jgi:hypothetical protein
VSALTLWSDGDADDFAELEAVVAHGLATFVEVGTALAAIRDRRLYRQRHATFEEYCEVNWGMSRKRAYDLIAGAEVVAALSPIGDTPAVENEGQARALGTIVKTEGPERAAEVLQQVAAAGPVTAAAITAAVTPKAEDRAPRHPRVPEPPLTGAAKVEADHREWIKKLRDALLSSMNNAGTAAHPNNIADTIEGLKADPPPSFMAVNPATIRAAGQHLISIADYLEEHQ